jgi:hypothetical protein
VPIAAATHAPVETYLTELSRALSGPRRRRADLMTEARDSLEDATEAFEADGLSRRKAEERAVADFGELGEVVPGYRAELGIAQGRRTALALCLVMLAQPIVWLDGAWSWSQDSGSPTPYSVFLNQLVMVIGGTAIAGTVIALLASGIGLRYPAVRDRVTRATAVFALLSGGAVGVVSIAMATTSAVSNHAGVGGLGIVFVFVLLPLALVGRSATRCLSLA